MRRTAGRDGGHRGAGRHERLRPGPRRCSPRPPAGRPRLVELGGDRRQRRAEDDLRQHLLGRGGAMVAVEVRAHRAFVSRRQGGTRRAPGPEAGIDLSAARRRGQGQEGKGGREGRRCRGHRRAEATASRARPKAPAAAAAADAAGRERHQGGRGKCPPVRMALGGLGVQRGRQRHRRPRLQG